MLSNHSSCPGLEIGSQRESLPGDGPVWGFSAISRPALHHAFSAWQNRLATGDVGSFQLSRPVLLRDIRKAVGRPLAKPGGRGPLLPVGLGSAAPGLASQQKAVTAISTWGRVFTRMLDAPPVESWPVPPEGGGQVSHVKHSCRCGVK